MSSWSKNTEARKPEPAWCGATGPGIGVVLIRTFKGMESVAWSSSNEHQKTSCSDTATNRDSVRGGKSGAEGLYFQAGNKVDRHCSHGLPNLDSNAHMRIEGNAEGTEKQANQC